MTSQNFLLQERRKRFVRTWPVELQRLYWPYHKRRLKQRGKKRTAGEQYQPYWILLPKWLMLSRSPSIHLTKSEHQFLMDVLWGQYCLYATIRIQDDIFDGQEQDRSLGYAARLFLVEARRTYANHFARDRMFWRWYRDFLHQTVDAILTADSQQRSQDLNPKHLLNSYARVCAIFKVGSLAVCSRYKRMNHMGLISKFTDALAIEGQIRDDLKDLNEDFQQGRLNSAARLLIGNGIRGSKNKDAALGRRAQDRILRKGIEKLFAEIESRHESARRLARKLKVVRAENYVQSLQHSAERLRAFMQRKRVDFMLSGKLDRSNDTS